MVRRTTHHAVMRTMQAHADAVDCPFSCSKQVPPLNSQRCNSAAMPAPDTSLNFTIASNTLWWPIALGHLSQTH